MTAFVIACYGPVDRYLGMLAFTTGALDKAEIHLRDALAQCREMGAPVYEAHSRYWLARVAKARGDPVATEQEAGAALVLARRVGMAGLVDRLEELVGPGRL